jgi:zinc transport system permease protein
MLDDFVVRAALAGVGVAVAAGPLGCFVVWRRMAIFGEALANAMLLGVILATVLELQITLGVLLFALLLAASLLALERQRVLPLDTVLSLVAHAALAFGLVALNWMDYIRVDLMSYLFGDVLATSRADLAGIALLLVLLAVGIAALWRPLLAATVQPEIAAVEGVNLAAVRFAFTLMLAALIAVGMKIVGMLLIVSLLVVPAATARQLARTPEAMAAGSALVGVSSVVAGLLASLRLDLPAGPAIVSCAFLLFVALTLARSVVGSRGSDRATLTGGAGDRR